MEPTCREEERVRRPGAQPDPDGDAGPGRGLNPQDRNVLAHDLQRHLKGDVMRIRRLVVPIAILRPLVVLGGVTAGLIWAWSPAPISVQSNLQAADPPA